MRLPVRESRVYKEVREHLQTGDLLFFAGRALSSGMIRRLTKSPYSHVGVVLSYEDNQLCIEAVPSGGVRVVRVSDLVNHYDGRVDYYRVRDVSDDQRKTAIGFCLQQLGRAYNYLGILRFLRFLLTGAKERFRQGERRRGRDGWFCSEIVSGAYERAQADLVPANPSGYTSPADLAESERVEFAFRLKRR